MNRVLFLTKEYPPNVYGGAGVHVEYLSRELAKLMSVDVRSFGDQSEAGSEGTPAVRGSQIDESRLAAIDPRLRKVFEPLAVNLEWLSQPVDADLVHCHTWYSMMAGLWAKIAYGIPLVVTTHSLEPLRPWKEEQLGRGYHLSSWIEKMAIESADAVIAVSQDTRREVLESYNVPEERVRVIHNGIDLAGYTESDPGPALAKYGVDPNKPYVLFVGRITRQKGVVHLVRALEKIDPAMQVVLCAGAPDTDEILAEMESAVAEVSTRRPGVHWIQEMVPLPDVIGLYSGASVFVCPSVYEPFGIINLEAMACRCPVVASQIGGIPEVVVPEETGLLVPFEQRTDSFEPANPEAFSDDLAAAVNRLVADEGLRNKMADAGRQRVEDHFSWESIAKQTAALYEEVLTPAAGVV